MSRELKALMEKLEVLYREPEDRNDNYRLGRNAALDDVIDLIDAALAAPDLPPICSTVEDVVRAAPEAGVYWVLDVRPLINDAGELVVDERETWNATELRIDADGTRTWWLFGWESGDTDMFYVGWRISPRIRMPGEGA